MDQARMDDGRVLAVAVPDDEVPMVPFGDQPWQQLPLDRAEWMLRAWREKNAKQFGDCLRDCLLAER